MPLNPELVDYEDLPEDRLIRDEVDCLNRESRLRLRKWIDEHCETGLSYQSELQSPVLPNQSGSMTKNNP